LKDGLLKDGLFRSKVTSYRTFIVDFPVGDLVAGVELQVVGELEVHDPGAELDLGVGELADGLGHHDLAYLVDALFDRLAEGLALFFRRR
jgi:hypothetical protein